MFCFNRSLLFLFVALAIVSAPNAVNAQEKKAKKSGFNIEKFLKRLDLNKNGKVDPDEIRDDKTRAFLKEAGVDPSKSINIKKFSKQQKKKRNQRTKQGSGQQTMGFTVGDDERDKETGESPGFAVTDEERQPLLKLKMKQFSKEAKDTLEWALRNYDKNKNGKIDPNEIKSGRWADPPVSESDTNKDGSLSRTELLVRYQKRVDKKAKDKASDRGGWRSRNRKRDDDKDSRNRNSAKKSNKKSADKPASRNLRKSYFTYVNGLFKTHDKNKDGSLDKEEVDGMRRKPDKNADANGDGKIGKDELINWYVENAGQGSKSKGKGKGSRDSKSRRSSDSSSSSQSSNPKVRPQLTNKDVNKNGKIEMAEYGEDWTVEMVDEFYKIDKNRDGVITKAEWDNK